MSTYVYALGLKLIQDCIIYTGVRKNPIRFCLVDNSETNQCYTLYIIHYFVPYHSERHVTYSVSFASFGFSRACASDLFAIKSFAFNTEQFSMHFIILLISIYLFLLYSLVNNYNLRCLHFSIRYEYGASLIES